MRQDIQSTVLAQVLANTACAAVQDGQNSFSFSGPSASVVTSKASLSTFKGSIRSSGSWQLLTWTLNWNCNQLPCLNWNCNQLPCHSLMKVVVSYRNVWTSVNFWLVCNKWYMESLPSHSGLYKKSTFNVQFLWFAFKATRAHELDKSPRLINNLLTCGQVDKWFITQPRQRKRPRTVCNRV